METQKKLKNKISAVVFSGFTILALATPHIALANNVGDVGNAIGIGDKAANSIVDTAGSAINSVTSGNLCNDISKGTGGFFSCGTATTSFTEFKGVLSVPDPSGYADGLKANTDLRLYIKNVVNFALGFLGIIAMVVVIYGGFLYVTAAGKEEQAGKGKKALTYAIIGILIILSSFALVNTVLLAGGGTDKNKASAPGTNANQNAHRQALFAYAGSVVQTIAHDFVTAYQNYTEINNDLATLANVEVFKDMLPDSNAQAFRISLQQRRNILANVNSKAGALSQVAEAGQKALLIIDKYLNLSNKALDQIANAKETKLSDTKNAGEFFANLGINYKNLNDDFSGAFSNPVGKGSLPEANKRDFAQAILKARNQLNRLYQQMKGAGLSDEVMTAFKDAINSFGRLLQPAINDVASTNSSLFANIFARAYAQQDNNLGYTVLEVDNKTVLQIVNGLGKLYDLVKDLQFVYTVITSDKTEGNAPLLVNFDGLKSVDPNNHTIDKYDWTFEKGKTATGPTASYIFTKPGSYVVQLKVTAPAIDKDKGQILPADGMAYQTIIVRPPSSKINLQANVGGDVYPLSSYVGPRQVVDQETLALTTKEGKAGVTFDASKTEIGAGDKTKPLANAVDPAKVHWDFGDKNNKQNVKDGPPSDANLKAPGVKYTNEGNYRVLFEVTDERGEVDRKFVNVQVAPIIARIKVSPANNGNISQEFTFDGSASSSDASQIKTYNWTVTDEDGKSPSDLKLGNVDHFKYTFTKAGSYNVNLEVSDGGSSAQSSTRVQITSKAPVAQFVTTNNDPTHPNLYTLDASSTYDPDAYDGEVVAYNWEVNPPDCTYYKWLPKDNKFEDTTKAGTPCAKLKEEGDGKGFSKDNAQIKLKLNTRNQYTLHLDVQDQKDPDNSVPQEQTLEVANVLDVAWGGKNDGSPIICNLGQDSVDKKCKTTADKTGTIVTFDIFSENALDCEVDTGDGQKESCKGIDSATHTAVVTHTYTQGGAFKAKLSVFDDQDNANAITRKVFIGNGQSPMAAFSVNKNGEDVAVGDATQIVEGTRLSAFTFDGTPSVNIDGSHRNLTYSWDFGDGSEKSTKKTVTHVFKDTNGPDATYNVTLLVADQASGKQSNKDTVKIHIQKDPPQVSGLVAIPASGNDVTPLQVNVSAAGASDADGKIVSYKWYYYQVLPTPDDTQLGVQITTSPSTTLTIGTKGEEKEKHTYKFGVIATDNDGLKFDSATLNQSAIPSVEVTNGPNKAPVAKFSVDRSNISVGDSVNFSSNSTDSDGKIAHYMWNFDGQGFTDPNDPNYDKASVSFKYTKPAKDGVKVLLRVDDDNFAEAVSDPVTIFVDAKSSAPVAAFTSKQLDGKKIQFTNNSTADTVNGAALKSYTWDFDLKTDANGDNIPDNDIQSTVADPVFEYPDYGIYRAKITVTDDQGNVAFVTNFVNVKAPASVLNPEPSAVLQARLLTNPATSVVDGRIHLQGDSADVKLDYSSSTGEIKKYIIDKNIYYDSNGNGLNDDDTDFQSDKTGTWTTTFFRNYGHDTVRLTVLDAAGKKSIVDKEITFDRAPAGGTKPSNPVLPTLGGAFVLAGYEVVDWQLLLVSLVGFGIFIISILNKKKYGRTKSKSKSK